MEDKSTRSVLQATNRKQLLWIFSAICTTIAGVMVFQDYLGARRIHSAFYFSESFLFKTICFVFIPILVLLYSELRKRDVTGPYRTTSFIVIPILLHYFLLGLVFLFFSEIFFGGRYDLYKIWSYTLANDFYLLVVVYTFFVLGYKYFSKRLLVQIPDQEEKSSPYIVINSGKNNSIVNVSEIIQVLAATPYVTIQTQKRKYLYTASLKSLHEFLDPTIFVRVHKSAIVNIHQVVSFKSRLNGDYDLQLGNGDETRLSRTYAAEFKRALANRVSE